MLLALIHASILWSMLALISTPPYIITYLIYILYPPLHLKLIPLIIVGMMEFWLSLVHEIIPQMLDPPPSILVFYLTLIPLLILLGVICSFYTIPGFRHGAPPHSPPFWVSWSLHQPKFGQEHHYSQKTQKLEQEGSIGNLWQAWLWSIWQARPPQGLHLTWF